MYNKRIICTFKTLNESEVRMAENAIVWLASKHLKPNQIATLTEMMLDRESKVLEVPIETKHIVYYRHIKYQGTAFDEYLKFVLPHLMIRKWLFPDSKWPKRNPTYGFHIRGEDVENFLKNRRKRMLISLKRYSKIEASTKESHLTKQITVGRRIALRA